MKKEMVDQITKYIAMQLLAWTWFIRQEPCGKLMPPTEEQALTEYRNSAMFHRVVDTMVYSVLNSGLSHLNAAMKNALNSLDADYYQVVVDTQSDPEILKGELQDLVDEIRKAQEVLCN